MKSLNELKYNIILIFPLLVVSKLLSAQHPLLNSFDVFYKDGHVHLDWVMKAGSTCNGINIFRSTDSKSFIQIGDIEGICGSPATPLPYSFVDENPVPNKINYYRLELGVSGFSEILSIEIIAFNSNNYQVRPNPATTQAKIYFQKESIEEYQLVLHNLNGSHITKLLTMDNYFELDVSHLRAGMYVFTITNHENTFVTQGKIIVQ